MLVCILFRRKLCLLGALLLMTFNNSVLANKDVRSSNRNAEEMKFANGTVVGKYAYVDSEGTPVHVRYFADDNSYGVELRSMKISQPQVESSLTPNKDTVSKNRKGEANDNTNFEFLNQYNSTVNIIGPSLQENVVDNDLAARTVGVHRKRVRRNFKKKSRSLNM